MKTADPGCCGPVSDRVKLIREAEEMLIQGHMGLSALYAGLTELPNYQSLHDMHKAMSEELSAKLKEFKG